jgi:hypothetical protein
LRVAPAVEQDPLFDEIRRTRFTWRDMDNAYQQGIEDLADKVIELVFQTDGEITAEEIVEFLEAEIGFGTASEEGKVSYALPRTVLEASHDAGGRR